MAGVIVKVFIEAKSNRKSWQKLGFLLVACRVLFDSELPTFLAAVVRVALFAGIVEKVQEIEIAAFFQQR